jgi:RimJ/RimL family protein N-acetyltransferase
MEITTSRLLLREFTMEDEAALHRLETDPAVRRYMGGGQPTQEETRAFLHRIQHALALDPRPSYTLAMVVRGEGRLMGVVRLTVTNRELGQAELGYRLSPAYWGRGYASEAARALVDFGFSTIGLHRVCALCHPDNSSSQRVMQKVGMHYEGHLREDWRNRDGSWRDSLLYAILEQDWRALEWPETPVEG